MMWNSRRIFILAMTLLGIVGPTWAGLYEKGGAIGLGARSMGLAGAYSALAEDETAIWWNPAGLGEVNMMRLGWSLESLYDGRIRSLNLALASPLPAHTAAGFHWMHSFYPQATEINVDTLALAGSLPLSSDQRLRLGASLKALFGHIRTEDSGYFGLGLDFGLRFQQPLTVGGKSLVLALRIQDLDTRINWRNGVEEQVPQSVALGSAWHFDDATVAVLDLEMVHSGQEEGEETRLLRLGLERSFREVVSLRAGYLLDNHRASTFSFGVGAKIADWEIQYALLGQLADMGLSHRLSLSYGLPPLLLRLAAPPTPLPTPVATPLPEPTITYQVELITLPERFSPNGDGVADTVILQMNLKRGDPTEINKWRLTLENVQAEKVEYFEGQTYTEQWEWDGSNQAGNICPEGVYRAHLELWDASNKLLAEASQIVNLLTKLPPVQLEVIPQEMVLIAGQPEQPVHFRLQATGDISALEWKLLIRTPVGKMITAYSGQGQIPSTMMWKGQRENGQQVPPGEYHAILVLQDLVGLSMNIMQPITLKSVEPKVTLQVAPQLLKLKDKKKGQAVFTLDSQLPDKVRRWDLTVREALTQKIVRQFMGEGPPPEKVVWNAQDQNGQEVKAGVYFHAQVSVTFRGGGVVKSQRQALATDLETEKIKPALALHLTAILFTEGSATIPLDEYKRLQQAADTIKRYAKQYRVQIKGYTDRQEAPGRELELSWERAQKVEEYLNLSGKIPSATMAVIGYGAHLPLASEDSAAGRRKNRRVEVVLIIEK